MQWLSKAETDNQAIAEEILKACNTDKIFAFYGNLGAGKTNLVKWLCSSLQIREHVTSPTFNLINTYQEGDVVVHHFDFYRIKSEVEAYDIGCDEYFDSGAYCFIEWPEKIPTLLPPESAKIHIQILPNSHRSIELSY